MLTFSSKLVASDSGALFLRGQRGIDLVREQVVGRNESLKSPFQELEGELLKVYLDYTASGQALQFLLDYLKNLLVMYANSHTVTSATGDHTTKLLALAEQMIAKCVHASSEDVVIGIGTGSTGAIKRLQEILGIYLSPATREQIGEANLPPLNECPIVFVTGQEHHSNEISWREGLAKVVEIGFTPDGEVDLADLEAKLKDPQYVGRQKIVSFSAASNVTGQKVDVQHVARLAHQHGAYAFFDYAARAPYDPIDMNPAGGEPLDAVFISSHKFPGGPAGTGVLVMKRALYNHLLPPTYAGGGTVEFVSPRCAVYTSHLEERERAGTPGIIQTWTAALAMELPHLIGWDTIHEREHALLESMLRWMSDTLHYPERILLGDPDPTKRIPIVSFNLKHSNRPEHKGRILHPYFVAQLLNDLFGIQCRAGCSCAGPYGHYLLGVDEAKSEKYRHVITERGWNGMKPGWARFNLPYTVTDDEFIYLKEALHLIGTYGHKFLQLYRFSLESSLWRHVDFQESPVQFGITDALAHHQRMLDGERSPKLSERERNRILDRQYLAARQIAKRLPEIPDSELTDFQSELRELGPGYEDLAFFYAYRPLIT